MPTFSAPCGCRPFLVLNPACVALGAATANLSGRSINPWHLLLVLIGTICAHGSVNALNEHDGFKSGLDFKTQRTPFSGGSGTLPQNPDMARYSGNIPKLLPYMGMNVIINIATPVLLAVGLFLGS